MTDTTQTTQTTVVETQRSTLAEKVAWYKKYREYIIGIIALVAGIVGGKSDEIYKFRPVSIDRVQVLEEKLEATNVVVSNLQQILLNNGLRSQPEEQKESWVAPEESPTENTQSSQVPQIQQESQQPPQEKSVSLAPTVKAENGQKEEYPRELK